MKPVYVMVRNQRHKIPSKFYPLAQPAKMTVMTHENTAPFSDSTFDALINDRTWETGRCYTNALRTVEILTRRGYDAEYFAGWLVIGGATPIHHAWAICSTEKGTHLFDLSISIPQARIFWDIDTSDPTWRQIAAQRLRAMSIVDVPSRTRIIGQVPEDPPCLYVGCPDTIDNARRMFNRLIQTYPQHPSYAYIPRNEHGATPLQEMLGLKRPY